MSEIAVKLDSLIVVEQLPIIKENLKAMKKEIADKTEMAQSLICTEETRKEVKEVRAELTKQFNELEAQRKAVKTAVLAPYEEFEAVYKECITEPFKTADSVLKEKIAAVENELKSAKEKEVLDYFYEYRTQLGGLDWVEWTDLDVNITLSASEKKLKTEVKGSLDRIFAEVAIINLQFDKEEIFVEYKKCRNVEQAITTVRDRKAQLAKMAELEAERKARAEQEKAHEKEIEQAIADSKPPVLETPVIEPQEEEVIYSATFTVKGSLEQLKAVKGFLEERGIEYEC